MVSGPGGNGPSGGGSDTDGGLDPDGAPAPPIDSGPTIEGPAADAGADTGELDAFAVADVVDAARSDAPEAGAVLDAAPLAPFNAPFLWRPITFAGVVDHGDAVRPTSAGSVVMSGPVALREVGATSGLERAVGGGPGHGVGIAFVDVDGDGYEDIFVANGRQVRPFVWFDSVLYRNRRDGTFEDVTDSSGIRALLTGKDAASVAVADYDADGDLDLYVGTHPTDMLLANDGRGRFADVTAEAGAGGPVSSERLASARSKIASWGDYNGDGWLDVAVATSTIEGHPENGYLLQNRGDGTFTDVTARTLFAAGPVGNPCAVLWSDYDNDGDQDLWIWNDAGDPAAVTNRALLRNDRGLRFSDVAIAAGLTDDARNPMGIDGADVNRDGFLDYYISEIGGHPFYLSEGDGSFRNILSTAGAPGRYGWGLGFEDLNADTWTDLFVAQEDDLDYLTHTHDGVIPPHFTTTGWKHAPLVDAEKAHNVAVAFADYDHSGTVDAVTASTDGSRLNLFRNETSLGTNHWLEVKIARTPRTGEKGGVSARVVVKTGDLVQFRDVSGGSSRASNNATSVRFGLGQWTGAEWVAALWPDGRELSARNVRGNRIVTLRAP